MNNHTRFLKHLEFSHEAKMFMGSWFIKQGNKTTICPDIPAPTAAQHEAYADNGDLYVNLRIEVKRLSRNFTCKKDWIFGEYLIVCEKRSWDRANPKPFGYYILSKDMEHAIWIAGITRPHWYVEERQDYRYEGEHITKYYFCPLGFALFFPIH